MLDVAIYILIGLHLLACFLMVLVVLIQRPRSEGLGSAFGGEMTENLFGAQSASVLTKFTVWLGVVFFVLTLLLAMLYAKRSTLGSNLGEKLLQGAATEPAAPAAPVAPVQSPVPGATADPSVPAEAIPALPAPAPEGGVKDAQGGATTAPVLPETAAPALEAVPKPTVEPAPATPAPAPAPAPAMP